ncbi:putative microtubule-severing ATPase [Helianthus annuus]|uniref:Microtubule-severing ATPase n=1 Tax=Helianthus annuus TaxID=4232 RepID=A0A9K3IN61_HELAN|nr:putative microtubule-severing ATPase [Helianthus annuus]KAJ0551046.1 putative microtubule-severing ATPase [Helianthus annuus]KAJ0557973.1 putative microtubule-severing ATPase [Helianthus annuus]KAJ0564009.1 putative microtubule-severing ATPase [Helianthus annuus]KAJ0729345.1 putative microtubule-severing ATPase [Helianthus annuus]
MEAEPKPSSSSSSESSICWRKQLDANLKRLQSLLFGADIAIQKGDYSYAQLLSLRLIGFLDSHCLNDEDEALIRPIRREAVSKLESARQSLLADSDRQAFEQAGKDAGFVFHKQGDINIEKIKESKYFKALLKHSKVNTLNEDDEHVRQEDISRKALKGLLPVKATLYGGILGKNNSTYNSSVEVRGSSTYINADEDRTNGSHLRSKRAHMEISSPKIEKVTSPSSNSEATGNGFVTARTKLELDVRQKRGLTGSPNPSVSPQSDGTNRGYGVKSYGTRRGIRGFVPPIKSNGGNTGNVTSRASKGDDALDDSTKRCMDMLCGPDGELPEKLRNLEPRLIEHISNEIMDRDPNVRWDDIGNAGLHHAKKCVTEMVIWPLLRPDIFKGVRSPGRGLLLFGPPGTGKTMIGKAIAGEAKATFFYISASSLTSKWIGEGEKLVRALFGVASCRQPAVIFVDEIDSLLSQRKSDGEHESSRRMKTQFLIEMEGFDNANEQVLLIGATNRPQELDEAARRRLTKRLYIPLPSSARAWIIRNLLMKDGLFNLSTEEIDSICKLTEGYSGSDMKNLVKDASMGPLREAMRDTKITELKKEDMRPVTLQDFENALQEVRPSVSVNELGTYESWNNQFGSLSI